MEDDGRCPVCKSPLICPRGYFLYCDACGYPNKAYDDKPEGEGKK